MTPQTEQQLREYLHNCTRTHSIPNADSVVEIVNEDIKYLEDKIIQLTLDLSQSSQPS